MTKNPFINALLAALYISLIATFLFYGPEKLEQAETPLIPIAMLSLFVFSAAVMGFLFFYQPVQMYLDGAKKEAAALFISELGVFGAITVIFIAILFFASV
ncbi:MAG TPA: hypothetical protein VD928_02930 [Candidatus Paceibacterota bacterium]|nr:hypothetical protein [Candidatus Paceibacterota bacterium]